MSRGASFVRRPRARKSIAPVSARGPAPPAGSAGLDSARSLPSQPVAKQVLCDGDLGEAQHPLERQPKSEPLRMPPTKALAPSVKRSTSAGDLPPLQVSPSVKRSLSTGDGQETKGAQRGVQRKSPPKVVISSSSTNLNKKTRAVAEEEQIAHLEYQRMDLDHDGALTLYELKAGLSRCVEKLRRDTSHCPVLRLPDPRSNVPLTNWRTHRIGYTEEEITQLFENIDFNGDAVIQCDEWVAYKAERAAKLSDGLGRGKTSRRRGSGQVPLHAMPAPRSGSGENSVTAGARGPESNGLWDEVFATLLLADYVQCLHIFRCPLCHPQSGCC
jgi:hypothetical protein